MRIRSLALALAALGAAGAVGAAESSAAPAGASTFIVLLDPATSTADAKAAIAAAGGEVERYNAAVGVATVSSTRSDFVARADAQAAVQSTAENQSIGQAPAVSRTKAMRDQIERLQAERDATRGQAGAVAAFTRGEPLASLQWDMQQIHATYDGSYRVQQGSRAVRVGILDTGVDGSHPDIKPNFDSQLSRNFTVDDPIIDGPCADDPDGSCEDPADVDEDGHGTHVAGTIGAPLNHLGIGGVAPRVDIVNLRAGQDSGYFFLQPTVDALTYAGDHGIDVVNMSYYIDPWLYNCAANPADTPAQQLQQRTIIEATQRAVTYAHDHGVTLIAAAGNEATDLGYPDFDDTSPDYPPDAAYPREIDNSCLDLPTEAEGVTVVSSTARSGRKAYYSNYGTEQTDVAAPGGDAYDNPEGVRDITGLVLAPYPKSVALAAGDIDEAGEPTTPFVVKSTGRGHTGYYQYLQGTSMAAPHATGVAALIVAEYGVRDTVNGGVKLSADKTSRLLQYTATSTPCPSPRLFQYPGARFAETDEFDAYCEGDTNRNGFFGDGIVDALGAVTHLP